VSGTVCPKNAVFDGISSFTSVPASFTLEPLTMMKAPRKLPLPSKSGCPMASAFPMKASLLGMTIEA
jgi:hypothetical protein